MSGAYHPQFILVIAHEVAHVHRRDDLMRWLELVSLLVFCWNPIAWFARCRLREAEEECCHASVVWTLPSERRPYGQAILKTIESLDKTSAASRARGERIVRSVSGWSIGNRDIPNCFFTNEYL